MLRTEKICEIKNSLSRLVAAGVQRERYLRDQIPTDSLGHWCTDINKLTHSRNQHAIDSLFEDTNKSYVNVPRR